jgi:cyclin C
VSDRTIVQCDVFTHALLRFFHNILVNISGCLQIACVIQQKDSLKTWFAELHVDLDKIQEITKYIINLFDLWKSYDEKKEIKELLAKIPKPKSQTTR